MNRHRGIRRLPEGTADGIFTFVVSESRLPSFAPRHGPRPPRFPPSRSSMPQLRPAMAAAYLCAVLAGRAMAQRRHRVRAVAAGHFWRSRPRRSSRFHCVPVPARRARVQSGTRVPDSDGTLSVDALLDGEIRTSRRLPPSRRLRERLVQGAFALVVERPIGGSRSASNGFAIGLAVDADVAVTTTGYADPDATSLSYMLGFATLGPAAAAEGRLVGQRRPISAFNAGHRTR